MLRQFSTVGGFTLLSRITGLIRENLVATLQEMLDLEVVGWAEDEAGAMRWLPGSLLPCNGRRVWPRPTEMPRRCL